MQIELYVILKEIHSLFLLATLYILLYFTAVMWNEMSNNDELQADPVFANSFLATTTSTVTTTPGPAPHQRRGPASPRPPRVPCDSPYNRFRDADCACAAGNLNGIFKSQLSVSRTSLSCPHLPLVSPCISRFR